MTAFAWTLLHFVWQGALLGALAVIMRRLVTRPTVRYAVGVGTMALMVVAPALTLAVLQASRPAGEQASRSEQVARPNANSPAPLIHSSDALRLDGPRADLPGLSPARPLADLPARRLARWQALVGATLSRPGTARAIVFCWLIGVFVFTLRLTGAWIVTRRLATRAIRPVADELETRARQMAERLALARPVRLYESAAVAAPMIVGWIRPIVLMPVASLAGLSIAQVDALIAHELAHLRRHDPIVNLLQSVAETLLFYHPAVWWVSRGVRQDREYCCDDLAISVTGDRLTYATALADLASLTVGPQVALAAGGGSLVERIARVLGEPERRSWTPAIGAVVLLSAIALAALAPLVASTTRAPIVASPPQADTFFPSASSSGLRRPPAPRRAATPTPVQTAPAPAAAPSTARIAGRVVGPDGAPVANVAIRLLEKRIVAGRAQLLPPLWGRARVYTGQGLTQADPNGQFSFGGLAAGTYYLLAAPEPFGSTSYEWMSNGPHGAGPTGFSPAYYPSGVRTADAAPIRVQGNDISNLTITLVRTQTGTIVLQPVSVPAPDQPANMRELGYAMANLYLAADGEPQLAAHMQLRRMNEPLVFRNLPVGEYISSMDPDRRISVRPGETTTVSILRRTIVALRGRASFEGGAAPASPGPAAVRLEPTNPISATFPGTPPFSGPLRGDQNWAFDLRIGPSIGVLRVDGLPGWALKSVTLNGRNITDQPLDFGLDVDGIEVLMTNRVGSVAGTVVDGNRPAASQTIVLYPEDRTLAAVPSRFTRLVRADDQGRFSVDDLLPGRYLALAFTGYESENADWVESMRAKATPFTVAEGARTNVTVRR